MDERFGWEKGGAKQFLNNLTFEKVKYLHFLEEKFL
jgi:hypothetical protein